MSNLQASGYRAADSPAHSVNMGLPIVDNAFLRTRPESREAEALGVHVYAAHLSDSGGTAAPFNALATSEA